MTRNLYFLGTKLVYPKGVRKSPKPNARARCMRQQMISTSKGGEGKKFLEASKACERRTGS